MAYRNLVCRLSVLVIVAAFVSYAQASMRPTNRIDKVTSQTFQNWNEKLPSSKLPPDTLIIFDVDETIVHNRDALTRKGDNKEEDESSREMLWLCAGKIFDERANEIIRILGYDFTVQDIETKTAEIATKIGQPGANAEDIKRWLKYWFEEWICSKSRTVISEEMKRFVGALQGSGYKTLVLTASSNTPQGSRTFMDLRKDELKMFNFAATWEGLPSHTWTDVDSETLTNPGVFPCYADGILMTGANSKSKILQKFLDYAEWQPTHIIFIDDKMAFLSEVGEDAKSMGIKFYGGLFLEAGQKKSKMPLSKERAIYQINYLLDNDVWLNDEEAEVHIAAEALYASLVERYGIRNEMPHGFIDKIMSLCKQRDMIFDDKMKLLPDIVYGVGDPSCGYNESEEWLSILEIRIREIMESTYQKCRDMYRGEPKEPVDIDQFSSELCMEAIPLPNKFERAKSTIEASFSSSMDLVTQEESNSHTSPSSESEQDKDPCSIFDTQSQNGDPQTVEDLQEDGEEATTTAPPPLPITAIADDA